MELFLLRYRETFLNLKRLFLMIPLYFLFRALINTIFYVRRPNLELWNCAEILMIATYMTLKTFNRMNKVHVSK